MTQTNTILAGAVLLAGVALLFFGCWCDPQGEIDWSLLVAFAECLTFAGTCLGVAKFDNHGKESKPKGS